MLINKFKIKIPWLVNEVLKSLDKIESLTIDTNINPEQFLGRNSAIIYSHQDRVVTLSFYDGRTIDYPINNDDEYNILFQILWIINTERK